MILSAAYLILRLIYAVGYLAKGPDFRAFGAFPILLLLLVLFGLSFYTSAELMKNYTVTIPESVIIADTGAATV